MKTINNIEDVKIKNFEIGEEYQFNLEGMKVATANLKVSGKDSSRGSGKKSVIFGELTLTDNEGKVTIYTQTDEIPDKGGWDITTLKNRILGTTTTAKGQRKATEGDRLKNVVERIDNAWQELNDLLNEEEQAQLTPYNYKAVAKSAKERLEKASKENKDAQKQLQDMISSGKFSTEQLLQIAQLMQSQQ